MIDILAKITGNLCGDCAIENSDHEHLEILVDGARTTVPAHPRRKRYGSRGSTETRRKVEAAKRRALRKLRYSHPEEYEVLLGAERRKVGLEPFPLGRVAMIRTVNGAVTYHERDAEDVDPRGQAAG